MSGKEMYERNPFSSSSFCSLPGTKKNAKEATIRGTPFHTVLDLSSNCEVACSLLQKNGGAPPQKKRKCVWGTTTANIHCLFATFPKSNVLQCTPKRDFCVGDFDLCMKRKKKRKERKYSIFSILFLFWAWQKEWTKNGPRPKKSKKSVILKPSVRLQVGHHW